MSEIDVTKCEYCNEEDYFFDCDLFDCDCSEKNCHYKQLHRYKQAIEEIKEIAKNNIEYKMYSDNYLPVGKTIIFEKIIQKCTSLSAQYRNRRSKTFSWSLAPLKPIAMESVMSLLSASSEGAVQIPSG